MATRAEQFFRRASDLGDTYHEAVYLVQSDAEGGDTDRGIRGNVESEEFEIIPRPVVQFVRGDLVTQSGLKLRAGDVIMDVAATALTEDNITSPNTQIRLGEAPRNQLMYIYSWDSRSMLGQLMNWRLYLRGISTA